MRLRTGMMALALALALGVAHEAAAQVPPHQFYGSSERGSSALVNGRVAPDGSTVSAVNQRGLVVASTVVADGDWVLRIDAREAREVRFRVGGSDLSEAYAVTSGALTEVRLALTAAVTREPRTVPPKPGLELYTVQEGDTLESIAEAAGLSTAGLLERNPQLEDADDIAEGDVIYLRELVPTPAPEEQVAPPAPVAPPVEPPVVAPVVDETPEPAPAAPAEAATNVAAGGGGPGFVPVAVVAVALVGAALGFVALRRRRDPGPPDAPETGDPEPPLTEDEAVPESGLARLRHEQEQLATEEVFQVRYDVPGEESGDMRQRANYVPPADPAPLTAIAPDVVAESSDAGEAEAWPDVVAEPSDASEAEAWPNVVAESSDASEEEAWPAAAAAVDADASEEEEGAAAPVSAGRHATSTCVALTGGGRRCADTVRGAELTLCPAHDRLARSGGTVLHWESGQAITEAARAEGSAAG